MGAGGGCGTANPFPQSAGEREKDGQNQDQKRQWQLGFLHKPIPPSKGNFYLLDSSLPNPVVKGLDASLKF
jgi:hypothetical protein